MSEHTIESLHARIVRLESTLALTHPPDVWAATAKKAGAETGGFDAAAVTALKSIIYNYGTQTSDTIARTILAEIRKGNVPGVYDWKTDFHDQLKAAESNVATLRRELAAEKSANEELHKMQSETVPETELDAATLTIGEAVECMRDFIHITENFSGITRPLDQIQGRCRAFLDKHANDNA